MTGGATLRTVARAVQADAAQLLRHGPLAPRFGQRIWVDPLRCDLVARGLDDGRRRSGQIIGGRWAVQPIETVEKLQMATTHWVTGASWEDVGAVEFALEHLAELRRGDGVATADDVVRRFARLDEIFDVVRRERRLRPRSELPGRSFRELGGVYVHIGQDGSPVFGNGGCHRLAIARVLRLPQMPAQIGVVHADAVGRWRTLRRPAGTRA